MKEMRFVHLTAVSKVILVQYLSGNSFREGGTEALAAIFFRSKRRLGVAELSEIFGASWTSILNWFDSYSLHKCCSLL